MTHVRFVSPGRPVPHERVVPKKGGNPFTSRRTREFEKAVALLCKSLHVTLIGETCVSIHLMIQPPYGDLDNYTKSILDGMVKGGLLVDDRFVRRLVVDRDPAIRAKQRAIVNAWEFPRIPIVPPDASKIPGHV